MATFRFKIFPHYLYNLIDNIHPLFKKNLIISIIICCCILTISFTIKCYQFHPSVWLYLISYHTTHNQYVAKPIEQYYFSIFFLKCEKIRHLSRLSRSLFPFSQSRSLFQVSIYHTSMTFFHILSSSSKRKDDKYIYVPFLSVRFALFDINII